jgi:hypothetical protein
MLLKFAAAFAASLALAGSAMSQTTPAAPAAQPTAAQTASLSWMAGHRVHTNPNGSKVWEAFLGPANGVITGTALVAIGTDRAYTEYHKIGPNSSGVYGLAVANTRSGMTWNFTPLKSIEPGRITFQAEDGSLTIVYYSEPGGGVGSRVDRVANGQTTTQEWHFKLAPPPQ